MKRWARAAVSRGLAVPLIAALVAAETGISWSPASSQLQDAKAQAAALSAKLAQLRTETQAAASNYQNAEAQVQQTQASIAATRVSVAAKQAQLAQLRQQVSREALSLFEQSGSTAPFLAIMQGGANTAAIVQEDVSTASSIQQQAVTSYQVAKQQLQDQLLRLNSLEQQQQAAVTAASQDLASIQANVKQARAQLASANQQVQQLIAQQQAAAAAAAAQAAAAAAASQAAAAQAAPQGPPPVFSNSGYANPLRAVQGLQTWRVDQGVDYAGTGAVYALGNGIVTITESGWPNGTYIGYRLTSGPAQGDCVYVAEYLSTNVSVGEQVNSNTVLGYMTNQGIETGWGNRGCDGTTMAARSGEWGGVWSTGYGVNFSQLLQSLGAPGGVVYAPVQGGAPGMPAW